MFQTAKQREIWKIAAFSSAVFAGFYMRRLEWHGMVLPQTEGRLDWTPTASG